MDAEKRRKNHREWERRNNAGGVTHLLSGKDRPRCGFRSIYNSNPLETDIEKVNCRKCRMLFNNEPFKVR